MDEVDAQLILVTLSAVSNLTTEEQTDTFSSKEEVLIDLSVGLWVFISPVILLIGVVGNALSLLVLCKSNMHHHNTSILLEALAVVDLAILLIGLTRQWILYTFSYDFRGTSSFVCKIHIYLLYSMQLLNAWIVVIISMERLYMVSFFLSC